MYKILAFNQRLRLSLGILSQLYPVSKATLAIFVDVLLHVFFIHTVCVMVTHLCACLHAVFSFVWYMAALKVLYQEMDRNQPDVPLLIFMNVSTTRTILMSTAVE